MLQFVTVTSANANNIIILPTPNAGDNCHSPTVRPATAAHLCPGDYRHQRGSGASAESAIAANTMVIAVCATATTWQAIGLASTTLAAVEAAA